MKTIQKDAANSSQKDPYGSPGKRSGSHVGQILASPLTHTTGAHGQTLAIHRYATRITELDDSAWEPHGYAWLCHTCRTVSGSARQEYTPTLHAAERHVCPRKGDR